MALSINLATSQYGIAYAGVYFRIVTAAISRTRNPEVRFSVMLDVAGYATKPDNDDTREVDFRRYHAPLTEVEAQGGADFLAKCYSWIAGQEDMASSIIV